MDSAALAKVEACGEKLKTASCDLAQRDIPECNYKGALAAGAKCESKSQCADGACMRAAGATCGVCAASAKAGGACTRDDDCELALSCAAGKCEARPALGVACTATGPKCVAGLRCAAGKCAQPAAVDVACTATGGECAAELQCVSDKCAAQQITVAKVGDTCGGNTICAAASCGNGKCRAFSKLGETCGTAEAPSCESDLTCGLNGKCQASIPPQKCQ